MIMSLLLIVLIGSFIPTIASDFGVQGRNYDWGSDSNPSGGLFPIHSQSTSGNPSKRQRLSWCSVSSLERKKCLDWARAIEDINIQFETREPFDLNLDCVQSDGKDQCMSMIDDERADIVLLDPGEISVAGRHHSLVPIMVERYAGFDKEEMGHYSVAIVKRSSASTIKNLADLRGKRACFSSVSHMASWTMPLATIIDLPDFEIVDCNNLVKSASHFFGNSCAPNAHIDKFNPTGDNPNKMSVLCERQNRHALLEGDSNSASLSVLKCLNDLAPSIEYKTEIGSTYGNTLNSRSSLQDVADVAFLPHNTIFMAEKLSLSRERRLDLPSRNELELLCPQGGRAPLDRWRTCNFGFVPAHAVVVSSRTSSDQREAIQKFLKTSIQFFSGRSSSFAAVPSSSLYQRAQQTSPNYPQEPFVSSQSVGQQPLNPESPFGLTDQSNSFSQGGKVKRTFNLNGDSNLILYPTLDVIFSSDMLDLAPLRASAQTFKGYLNTFPTQQPTGNHERINYTNESPFYNRGGSFSHFDTGRNIQYEIGSQVDYFEKLRRCPIPAAVLCVVSDSEYTKCQAMSKAFHAAGLKPELNCKLGLSALTCMQLVKNREADLIVLDAADIFLAGEKFGLIPIVAEQIDARDPHHYAVAVAKKSDQSTDLFNLKNKRSCHSGYFRGTGWIMPLNYLITNERLRQHDDCNSALLASEHFDKACAPGILSAASNTTGPWTIRNMCELCHGSGGSYCSRDASEPFFGETGSFRCLVEGGADVAFCRHTAIYENTNGKNRETWARNLIRSDFELLCRDGTRAPVDNFAHCNLGRVPSNAMVTRGDLAPSLIETYINLFMYGQRYYGSKYSEEYTFKLFSSVGGQDMIFQDVTQQLIRLPSANRTHLHYLGKEFVRAAKVVSCAQ